MAFSFITEYTSDSASTTSVTGSDWGSVAVGDIGFAFVSRYSSSTLPSATPSGWTKIGDVSRTGAYPFYLSLWYRVKQSGDSNPTWTWAASSKTRLQICNYRGGFDPDDPIADSSNTEYTTSNTTVRAASVDAVDGGPLVWVGAAGQGGSVTFTEPTGFAEDADSGSTSSDVWSSFASDIATSTGATGNIDGTQSTSSSSKHAFAVALNPDPGSRFVTAEEYNTSSGTSLTATDWTSQTDGDIGFVLVSRATVETLPSATPSGWTKIAEISRTSPAPYYISIWYRVKQSGDSNPTWTWAASTRTRLHLAVYNEEFDSSDPIADSSNTEYTTSNTTARAASVDAVDRGSVIWAGIAYNLTSQTFTPPGGYTEDSDLGATSSDLWSSYASKVATSTAATGDIDGTLSASTTHKHAFAITLNPEPSVTREVTGGTYTFTGGAVGTGISREVAGGTYTFTGGAVDTLAPREVAGGTYTFTGGTIESGTGSVVAGGTYTFTGGTIESELPGKVEGGTYTFTGGAITTSRVRDLAGGTYTFTGATLNSARASTPAGGTYTFTGGAVTPSRVHALASGVYTFTGASLASDLARPVAGGTYTFTGGAVDTSTSDLDISLYRSILDGAYAMYGCATFGNDTDGNYIWEHLTSSKDLIMGDGSTASTFPTLTTYSARFAEYYAFDGVDDYVSNWPTTPGFVSAAFSSAYPSGQPYVTQATDDTVKDLLTVGGAFTGNLHSLVFFETEPSAEDKLLLADYQLKRLWRDTYIDPYTARLIRNDHAVQVYDFQQSGSPYTDYALGLTATPTGITWSDGLTFDGSSSVVTISDVLDLRIQAGASLFVAGDLADGVLIEKGSNYSLSLSISGDDMTITTNGIAAASTALATANSVGVALVPGNVPIFYVDGKYHDVGGSAVTLPINTDDLLIGNTSGGGSEFEGTLWRVRICNRALYASEFELMHYSAMLGNSEVP